MTDSIKYDENNKQMKQCHVKYGLKLLERNQLNLVRFVKWIMPMCPKHRKEHH